MAKELDESHQESVRQTIHDQNTKFTGMNDNGQSNYIVSYDNDINPYINMGTHNLSDQYGSYVGLMHSNKMYSRNELYNSLTNPLLNKTWRFGVFNPYGALTKAKEFLFFTKPDLNIIARDDISGLIVNRNLLAKGLNSQFWYDVRDNKKRLIELLQSSYSMKKGADRDPFNHLLQNMVTSNLEVSGLQSTDIETATNMYGVGFSYKGSSEASDDNLEFSLEFKDDRWLNVYNYFRIYEEYETEKHHGTVRPWKKYIEKKILHDQIAIYKFIVDEDMETILYYGKYYGCFPTNLPRDTFSTDSFDNGLTLSIQWKAAFYEDMRPEILMDFNYLSKPFYDKQKYRVDIYNDIVGRVDNRPATAALVVKDTTSLEARLSPNKYLLKLVWRGSDEI